MDGALPTPAQIDALLAYLPLFKAWEGHFVQRWAGGEIREDGVMTAPYPVYADEVLAFFTRAGQPPWCDYGYVPAEAARMLEDDALIARATLAQVRTMLTYCVRGERFGDGFWGTVLERGRVTALLRRLAVLRKESL